MKKTDDERPKDAYVGFRATSALARTLVVLARARGLTISQFLRETIAQQSAGA